MVSAFDDDGVLLHDGGGRVVARARHGLRDQLPGTGIRHDLHRLDRCMPTSAVVHVPSRVVETTFAAPLIARLRLSSRSALEAPAAIDLSAVIGLAEHDDLRASGAANPHENLDFHARTSSAVLIEVAPPVRSRAPSPGQRPRATRRLRILLLGLHPFRGPRSPTSPRPTSPLLGWPTPRCTVSYGSWRSLTTWWCGFLSGPSARRVPTDRCRLRGSSCGDATVRWHCNDPVKGEPMPQARRGIRGSPSPLRGHRGASSRRPVIRRTRWTQRPAPAALVGRFAITKCDHGSGSCRAPAPVLRQCVRPLPRARRVLIGRGCACEPLALLSFSSRAPSSPARQWRKGPTTARPRPRTPTRTGTAR